MLEVDTAEGREPRSWLIEPHVVKNLPPPAYQILEKEKQERKLLGTIYSRQGAEQPGDPDLPVSFLNDIHAWMHYFFERVGNSDMVVADIQGKSFSSRYKSGWVGIDTVQVSCSHVTIRATKHALPSSTGSLTCSFIRKSYRVVLLILM